MNPRPGRLLWTGCLCLAWASAAGAAPFHSGSDKASTERRDLYGDPLPPGAVARMGTVRFRHAAAVRCVAWSPDGKLLAAGDEAGAVCLWNAADGKKRRQLDAPLSYIASVAFSGDGKTVAALCTTTANKLTEMRVALWGVESGTPIRDFETPCDNARAVAFAADGRTVLIACVEEDSLTIREAATGKVLRRLPPDKLRVLFAAFSGDGKTLVTAGQSKAFHRWEVATGKDLGGVDLPDLALRADDRIDGVAFAPDGTRLAVAFGNRLCLYDGATGAEIGECPHRFSSALAFSPDGKALAEGTSDSCAVRLWETGKTWKEIRPAPGHESPVLAMTLSTDGMTLATSAFDDTVRLWDATTGKELARIDAGGSVPSLCFSPDGKALVWGEEVNGGRVHFSATDSGKELRRLPGWEGPVHCLAISPDGRIVAAGADEGTILVWEGDAAEPRRLAGHPPPARSLAFSPDGKILAAAAMCGGDVTFWSIATGKEIGAVRGPGQSPSGPIAFSPDGKVIAIGEYKGGLLFWDHAAGKDLRQSRGWKETMFNPPEPPTTLAYSPDGRTIAAASLHENTIRLFETATGACRHELTGHLGGIVQVAFAGDGRLLASASDDGTALIWDLDSPPTRDSRDLSPDDLESCWGDLAGPDAAKAYRAIGALAAGRSASFLRGRLRPVPPPDAPTLSRLLDDLNSDELSVRDRASAELEKLADTAAAALQRVVKEGQSAEARRRAADVLEKLADVRLPAETLRGVRAVEALEHMNTADGRRLLEALSEGAPEARLTRDAKAALQRMAGRKAAP